MKHECDILPGNVDISRSNVFGWEVSQEDWDGSHQIYPVTHIKFCPFCGKNLEEKDA